MPRDELGGCLYVLARWVSGAEVARSRFRLRCGTWEPLAAMCPAGVDVVGVRENSKRLNPRGGEYRCAAGGRTAL